MAASDRIVKFSLPKKRLLAKIVYIFVIIPRLRSCPLKLLRPPLQYLNKPKKEVCK